MDPKAALFGTFAKMMGVDPAQLATVIQVIATAGERLERIERKLDFLLGNADPTLPRPQPGHGPGHGANGADRGI